MGVEVEYSTSKAVYHTDKIKLLQQGKPIIPTEIQIDLEAFCNDNCSFCSYRKEDGYNNEMLKMIEGNPSDKNLPIGKPSIDSRIPDDIVLDIPRQMAEAGIKACEITGGGEPTLHPKFKEFVRLLGEYDRDIGIVTNGSRLTDDIIQLIKENVMWLRISMDSATPEIHKKIHRTPNPDFEKRLNTIRKIAKDKPDSLVLGVSFIITPENIDDIEKAAILFKDVGVDHIRYSWMFDKQGTAGLTAKQIEYIGVLIPMIQDKYQTEKYRIFNEKNRIQLYTAKNDFKTCNFQRFVVAIGADSGCYPCCIMKYNKDFQYGNLKDATLREIVTSMNTDEFMKSLDPARCYPCWLSPRNASITSAIEKPLHHNFI